MIDAMYKVAAVFLGLAAIAITVVGLLATTQATLGVALICIGAVVAILARIVQAESNFQQTAKLLRKIQPNKKTP